MAEFEFWFGDTICGNRLSANTIAVCSFCPAYRLNGDCPLSTGALRIGGVSLGALSMTCNLHQQLLAQHIRRRDKETYSLLDPCTRL